MFIVSLNEESTSRFGRPSSVKLSSNALSVCPLYYCISKINITLAVDKVSMELISGRLVSFYVEKERLLRILQHQVSYDTSTTLIQPALKAV